ncbi:pro-neuregulin-1, membrane-bound isoform [Centroberyx affinis]|uniref:pro-neuregulin-1, membrane-bound isoform n=1 Tax=Centroberyx affinis TaxID=166261 RepID=UPI003A5C5869
MCVVAYCKTKKQRKKLHDRLRQSLRNERNNMASLASRPPISNSPLENFQLVNQYMSKNAMTIQHVTEKETETSFSTSQYASSAHQSTTVTHISSQSWSNGWTNSVLSDSQSILVMSLAENSQHTTVSHRGRLNATSGARELSAYVKNCRDTLNSYRDLPHSERIVSAVSTPTLLSPMPLASPATPGSPPSEMSAPLSSLATSVPSMAISPSAEEERPLLLATTLQSHKPARRDHNQHKRNSAHYNHGHEAHSPLPNPLMIMKDDDYQITPDHDNTVAVQVAPASPPNLPIKMANTNNNNNGRSAKRPKANGHMGHNVESNGDSMLESKTEEPMGEDTPFLIIDKPTTLSNRSMDSSRTNPASPSDDLQARSSFSTITKQDPIAV